MQLIFDTVFAFFCQMLSLDKATVKQCAKIANYVRENEKQQQQNSNNKTKNKQQQNTTKMCFKNK